MKAVLYARVSTKKQAEEGFSLRQQLEALRGYCEENNLKVVAEFKESFSGESLVRPALDDLLDLVETGIVDIVLAQDADRITRDPYNRHQLEEEFARFGTKLMALDDWGDDSHEGELLRYIRGWKAKGERLDIARRSRRGRRKKAKEGLVPGSGPAPYGFRYDKTVRTYVIDEEQMVWVRRIFAMIADGHSISETTRHLRQRAAPAPGGQLWHRSTVRDIILNDVYAGVYWWGRQKIRYEWVRDTESGKRRHKRVVERELYPQEEWISVPVPDSGVSTQVIERARKRIEGNTWTPSRNGDLVWELSGGIAVCAECGHRLKTHTTSNSAKKKYYYYICPARKTNQDNGACSNTKHYRKEELESLVGQRLADTLRYDTWREFVDKTIDQKISELEDTHRLSPGQTKERLLQRAEKLDSSIVRARELFIDGDISRPEYEQKKSAIGEEREILQRELSKLDNLDGAVKRIEQLRNILMTLGPNPDGDNLYIEYEGTPGGDDERAVDAYVDNPTWFTNRGGEPTPLEPDGGKRRASEKRLEFYRRMDLHVKVGEDMEITLDLRGVSASQSGETSWNTAG